MSICLRFFGDFVSTKPDVLRLSPGVESYIKSADIAVCNFESPVRGDFEPVKRQGPKVSQPMESANFILDAGFNVIQLANNHMVDFGEDGCKATLDAFKSVVTVGAGNFDEAYSVKIVEAKGKKIGFFSFVHHEFGVLDNPSKKDKVGTAWICQDRVSKLIIDSKKSVDFLVILPHAGIEEIDAPLPEWRNLYKHFIDCGADAVIGTHPHVPQGWETYNGKPIFYSLGNFYFDFLTGTHPYWHKSLMVELNINPNSSIEFSVKNIRFSENTICEDTSKESLERNKYICELLCDDKRYISYINKVSLDLWYDYRNWLSRGLGAISLRLKVIDILKCIYVSIRKGNQKSLLENCLQCESHRWTILRIQKLLN